MMKNYTAPDGSIHCIDPDYAYMLPEGCVEIGDEEAEAIRNPPKAQLQTEKVVELDAACAATILGGFSSDALGTAYTYPAKDTDQQNLASSVLASLMPGLPGDWTTPFWCADETGNWAMRPHTAVQIQQVGVDGKTAIIAAIQQKAALQGTLMAINLQAPDAAEQLEAIQWPAA